MHGPFDASVLVVGVGGRESVLDPLGGEEKFEVGANELPSLIGVDSTGVPAGVGVEEFAELLDVRG